jgi:ribosomal protein S18 acetylase RimI-like enzyme
MSMDSNIRRLRPEDAACLVSLRREALETDPLAFGASIDDDRGLSLEFVRSALADHQEQAVFGYFEGDSLSGMVGVIRASVVKRRHTAHIWGMYVSPPARRKGVGRALLQVTIEHARVWSGLEQLHLSVSDSAVVAKSLYEAAGFRSWGREPRALAWEGRFVDEFHLVLELHERRAVFQS